MAEAAYYLALVELVAFRLHNQVFDLVVEMVVQEAVLALTTVIVVMVRVVVEAVTVEAAGVLVVVAVAVETLEPKVALVVRLLQVHQER